jgi:hypothetical protein
MTDVVAFSALQFAEGEDRGSSAGQVTREFVPLTRCLIFGIPSILASDF